MAHGYVIIFQHQYPTSLDDEYTTKFIVKGFCQSEKKAISFAQNNIKQWRKDDFCEDGYYVVKPVEIIT